MHGIDQPQAGLHLNNLYVTILIVDDATSGSWPVMTRVGHDCFRVSRVEASWSCLSPKPGFLNRLEYHRRLAV